MSITYTEKGAGLHQVIVAAGHGLREENGKWVSSNDAAVQALIDSYSLADAQDYVCAQISNRARDLRDKKLKGYSPFEVAAWSIKSAEAMKAAESGKALDAPVLAKEAQARGITLEAMIAKVEGNAAVYGDLEAQIAGIDGKHRDVVRSLQSFDEVTAYNWSIGWPEV